MPILQPVHRIITPYYLQEIWRDTHRDNRLFTRSIRLLKKVIHGTAGSPFFNRRLDPAFSANCCQDTTQDIHFIPAQADTIKQTTQAPHQASEVFRAGRI